MRRREFLGVLGSAAVWPDAALAQQAARMYRIGFLTAATRAALAGEILPAFVEALRQLGWIEGKNLVIEFRYADNRLDKLAQSAAELVNLNVDVLMTGGTLAPLAAKQATTSIPIVFISGDPLGSELVTSLARPTGNLTGLSLMSSDVGGKRLELVKELLPRLSSVAILWNSANPYPGHVFKETGRAAKALNIAVTSVEVKRPNDFGRAFEAVRIEKPDALITVEDPLTNTHRKQIADFAAGIGLPSMHGFREFVEAGGLMSYGASLSDLYRRAAIYVDKILRGAKPGNLPVEQPSKFELVINLKTAKVLGLDVPLSLQQRADAVIE